LIDPTPTIIFSASEFFLKESFGLPDYRDLQKIKKN